MNLEKFLEAALNPPSVENNSTIIAKVSIYLAWQGWAGGQPQNFRFEWVEDKNSDASVKAREECQRYIDSAPSDREQYPNWGILTTVYAKDMLLAPFEMDRNWDDFVSAYYSEKGGAYDKLSNDEKSKIEIMPYNMVLEGISNGDVVNNSSGMYCKLQQKTNQYTKATGAKNKEGYDYRVYVIQEVYKNESDAMTAAKTTPNAARQSVTLEDQNLPTNSQLSTNNQLSKTAIEEGGYTTLEEFQGMAEDIHKTIANAQDGFDVNGKKMDPLSNIQSKRYAARELGFEINDLRLLEIETPF